jgi:hypothetical protein
MHFSLKIINRNNNAWLNDCSSLTLSNSLSMVWQHLKIKEFYYSVYN